MEGYLDVLEGPDGIRYTREVALLTGELHPVVELDDDGRSLQISPDGRFVAWERELPDGWVTRIRQAPGAERDGGGGAPAGGESVVGGGDLIELAARRVVLSATGRAGWLADDGVHLRDLDTGEERIVATPGLEPLRLAFAPDDDVLYVTAREGDTGRLRIARMRGPEWSPELLDLGPGQAAGPVPLAGGRWLAFTRPTESEGGDPEVGIADLESLESRTFQGESLVARGGTVAFLQREGPITRLVAVEPGAGPRGVPGTAPRSLSGTAPRVLVEADFPLSDPAVSPDGRRVAFQARPHSDWEIFVVGAGVGDAEDGAAAAGADIMGAVGEEARAPVRVTREIQHDLFPAWISDGLLLAMKGEFRHRRAHLYDVETGEGYELFHNNTLRTIAPQYDWVPHPEGRGVLIAAQRDGNTIQPEQAVHWVDLTRIVTHEEVVARVRRNLEVESDLLARGRERFAPAEADIRAEVDAVSVGRIRSYAEDLYAFGSKFVTEPGNALAREYLAAALQSWGYDVELQWFEASGRGRGSRTANVIATLTGTRNPEQVYVISSHFDSAPPSPGADDNSSGTTALLEAARVLADSPRRATIQFAFLTGEEAGLLGAREYVRRAQEEGVHIAGVLNNDMIGWTRSHRLDNTIRYSNDGIRDLQHAAAHLFSDLITYDARYYRSTDAGVFYEAYGDIVGGIGSYPVLGNPHYHQVTDQLQTIDQRLVAAVSRTTIATIMFLADGPSRVTGLHVADGGSGGLVLGWDPAPEADVEAYRVRVRSGDGGWTELPPTSDPRIEVPAAADALEVAVRSRYGDGRESFDDARLSLEDR